jgi:hypothetical protein
MQRLKINHGCLPRPVFGTTFFNHDGHDSILVRLPPLFVCLHDFVNPDIADKISSNQNKITGDDSMGVDITHRVAGREGSFGGHDWYNLDARARL